MRRMSNGNKAAMLAAFTDMRKDGVKYMFDCSTSAEKIMLNDLVEGKSYDFD